MKSVERTEIDGHTYEVTQYGSRTADKILFRLIKVLGPGVSQIGGDKSKEQSLVDGIGGLLSALNPEDLEWLRDQMIACTKVIRITEKGSEAPTPLSAMYDEHFKGRTSARMRLLVFALRVNFADFLDASALRSFVAAALAKVGGSNSISRSNATGSSGDSQHPNESETVS